MQLVHEESSRLFVCEVALGHQQISDDYAYAGGDREEEEERGKVDEEAS